MRSFLAPAIIALQRPDLHQFEEIKGSPGYEGHNFLKAGRASPGGLAGPTLGAGICWRESAHNCTHLVTGRAGVEWRE